MPQRTFSLMAFSLIEEMILGWSGERDIKSSTCPLYLLPTFIQISVRIIKKEQLNIPQKKKRTKARDFVKIPIKRLIFGEKQLNRFF